MKHFVHMLVGCVLPFLLIFMLPLFGVGEGVTMFVFVVLMFSCHLFMMRGHQHGDDRQQDGKGENHAHS
ncbi:hypothetical protein [uncultured Gimesia sp.]|uniref:hypothetical protein n=1 Tax=uncultured Gimesia sp. TaxID=1678688 RepID=UPI0030D7F03E